jgi:hypothetical protein
MRESILLDNSYPGFSLPQVTFRKRANIGRNLTTALLVRGEIDSLVIGLRSRHIIWQSWLEYLQRQVGGVERDPEEKRRAAEGYRRSMERSRGAQATALARSGWGPNHGKKGGSPHLTSRSGRVAQKTSPPPGCSSAEDEGE